VRLIFGRWAKRAEKKQIRQIVKCLGIDEISLRKGHQHFAMVLTDLERHCVVAVLEERSQKDLEAWLANLSEAERKAIFDNLKRNDAGCRLALQGAQIAERAKATAADDLAAAEDARRAYENELRRQWLLSQFGVNVDPAKFSLDNQF
jgi:hypothetical protein